MLAVVLKSFCDSVKMADTYHFMQQHTSQGHVIVHPTCFVPAVAFTWELVDASALQVGVLVEADAVPVDVAAAPVPPTHRVLKGDETM